MCFAEPSAAESLGVVRTPVNVDATLRQKALSSPPEFSLSSHASKSLFKCGKSPSVTYGYQIHRDKYNSFGEVSVEQIIFKAVMAAIGGGALAVIYLFGAWLWRCINKDSQK